MASQRRKCNNDVDQFCYICGSHTLPKQRRKITDFVKKLYFAYFKMKLGDQEKSWAPHIVCKHVEQIVVAGHWVSERDLLLEYL